MIEVHEKDLAYASPEELLALKKALALEMALSGPLAYAQYVSPGTENYPHIEYLDSLIVALIEHRLYKAGPGLPGIKNEEGMWVHPLTGERVLLQLAVSMPPRHGKSYLISEHLPAWFVTKYPEQRVILTSYEATFAAGWGRKARQHVEAHPEFGVKLDQSSRASDQWDLAGDSRGGMETAGAGGPITGKGFNLGIVDDPVKNQEDARSPTVRDNQEGWWYSTFKNRSEPDAARLLVMTRWHEDDLCGRLTAVEPEKWFIVNLPALAKENDPLGRAEGEALCPPRFPKKYLEELRDSPSAEGRMWFGAQYQGDPTIEDSGMFPRSDFRYYVREGSRYNLVTDTGILFIPLRDAQRFITVDLAISTKTSGDFTVFSCWDALPSGKLVLVDRWRDRIEEAEHIPKLLAFVARQRGPDEPKLRFVGIEKATYGISLIKNLIRHNPGFLVRPLDADKDKVTRAQGAGYAVKNHQVFFPKNASWLPDWESECVKFPNSTKDDQVDTFSYAVEVWQMMVVGTSERKYEENTMEKRIEKMMDKQDKPRKMRHPILGRY